MLEQRNVIKILAVVLAVAVLAQPRQAYAWSGEERHDRFHHDRHYHVYGDFVFGLPSGFISISLGGLRYYYCDGVFYRRSLFSYVVVTPPVGAVITTLPPYDQMVVMNGVTYYVSDGIYYQYTSAGYVVVTPVLQTPVVQGTFTVNIPNVHGGYTAVVIRRSGNGFVGPQGEFYREFLPVEQLRLMYAK